MLSDACSGDKTIKKNKEFIIIKVSIAITTTGWKTGCDLGEVGSGGNIYNIGVLSFNIGSDGKEFH